MTQDEFSDFVDIMDFFNNKKMYKSEIIESSKTYSHKKEQLIFTQNIDVLTLPEIDDLNVKVMKSINSRLNKLVIELYNKFSIEPNFIREPFLDNKNVYSPIVAYHILIGTAKYEYYLKKVSPEAAKSLFMEGTRSDRDFQIYQDLLLILR